MKAKIRVHIVNWNGWSDKQSEPKDIELVLGVDELIGLRDYGSPAGSIAVYELDEESLKIRVNNLSSKEVKGEVLDISTNKLGSIYSISIGQSLLLHTTGIMDAGCTCEVAFVGTIG